MPRGLKENPVSLHLIQTEENYLVAGDGDLGDVHAFGIQRHPRVPCLDVEQTSGKECRQNAVDYALLACR